MEAPTACGKGEDEEDGARSPHHGGGPFGEADEEEGCW